MPFSEISCIETIRTPLVADDKPGVIQELVSVLVAAGRIDPLDKAGVERAVVKREELGTTGIGLGVAIPHSKHIGVDRVVAAVGIHTVGVDFHSLDGRPAHLFFLLLSPPDAPADHLRALETISRQLRDENLRSLLKQATTAEEVWQLLEQADEKALVPSTS